VLKLLKQEVINKGQNYKMIENYLEECKLVPSEFVVKLLISKMEPKNMIYLIQGFPKCVDNLEVWNKFSQFNVLYLFFFNCNERTLKERLNYMEDKSKSKI
jgi:adenylate kinase family enzyme